MSLSKLSKLPPEVLSSVLNHRAIPLDRRLRLRLISNRWCDIIEDGLKKKTSLVVRERNTSYPNAKADDLIIKLDGLTDALIHTFVRLFPGTTQLALAFGLLAKPCASWSTAPSLLTQIGANLATVKLYGYIDHTVAEPLARALATLSGLTSLTLSAFEISCNLLPHLGPVLPRLEAFVCPRDFASSIIWSSLSPRCTRLLLGEDVFANFSAPLLAQLSTSLTHLQLMDCTEFDWNCLSQFHGLTSLGLDLHVTDLDASLLSHLAPFTRLTDLKLLYNLNCDAPLALPKKKETPLSTIKRLTLEVYFGHDRSPLDYQDFFKSIGAWFPAMTKLTLITSEDTSPAIQANLGQLPFSVEVLIGQYGKFWLPDW